MPARSTNVCSSASALGPQDAAAGDHETVARPAPAARARRSISAGSPCGAAPEALMVGIRIDDLVLLDLRGRARRRACRGRPGPGGPLIAWRIAMADDLGDAARIRALLGPLGDRLEGARPGPSPGRRPCRRWLTRRRTADRQQRRAVGPGVGDAGDQVRRARARRPPCSTPSVFVSRP